MVKLEVVESRYVFVVVVVASLSQRVFRQSHATRSSFARYTQRSEWYRYVAATFWIISRKQLLIIWRARFGVEGLLRCCGFCEYADWVDMNWGNPVWRGGRWCCWRSRCEACRLLWQSWDTARYISSYCVVAVSRGVLYLGRLEGKSSNSRPWCSRDFGVIMNLLTPTQFSRGPSCQCQNRLSWFSSVRRAADIHSSIQMAPSLISRGRAWGHSWPSSTARHWEFFRRVSNRISP